MESDIITKIISASMESQYTIHQPLNDIKQFPHTQQDCLIESCNQDPMASEIISDFTTESTSNSSSDSISESPNPESDLIKMIRSSQITLSYQEMAIFILAQNGMRVRASTFESGGVILCCLVCAAVIMGFRDLFLRVPIETKEGSDTFILVFIH
jgi:hypothetical protein